MLIIDPYRFGGAYDYTTATGYLFDIDCSVAANIFTDSAGTTAVTADGDLVRRINDKSGNGHYFTSRIDDRRPTYKTAIVNGLSVLRFDGSTDGLISQAGLLSAFDETTFSIYVVYVVSSSNSGLTFSFSAQRGGGPNGRLYTGANTLALYSRAGRDGNDSGDIETSSATGNVALIQCVRGGSGSLKSRINNSADESGTFSNATGDFSYISVGYFYHFSSSTHFESNYLNGDVCHIVGYTSNHDDTTASSVSTALMSKWGIT